MNVRILLKQCLYLSLSWRIFLYPVNLVSPKAFIALSSMFSIKVPPIFVNKFSATRFPHSISPVFEIKHPCVLG